jgi:hypothetical protein
MDEEAKRELGGLERTLVEFERAAKEALGFARTIRYQGIPFDIGSRFVIADMSPLAFFHLLEEIGEDGPQAAIERLYERLMPLLTCRHRWTVLKREADKPLQSMAKGLLARGSDPYVCTACTAYVFGGPDHVLPTTGKMIA